MLKQYIILSISFALCLAEDYKMNGDIVCTSWHNVTHLCNSWTVSTKIANDTACFPGDTLVHTQTGNKMMSDLQIGDILLGYDHREQKIVSTVFVRWLHFEKTNKYDFIELVTENDSLIVSEYHNIAYYHNNEIVYDYAMNSGQYDALFNGQNPVPIIKTHIVSKTGIYAPLTSTYNFLVSGSTLLVHSFAYVQYPLLMQTPFSFALCMADMWLTTNPNKNVTGLIEYIDPSIFYLMSMFGPIIDVDSKWYQTQLINTLTESSIQSGTIPIPRNLRGGSSSSTSSSSKTSNQLDKIMKMLGMSNFVQLFADDFRLL
jgi:hypothetical protein